MKALVWFAALGVIIALGYGIARWRRQWAERKKVAEERFAVFIAQAKPAAPPLTAAPAPAVVPAAVAPQERLLLDAANKAGEAGEPALSIQHYAKLLSRYPQTGFAAQARAAVEVQKKKLAKT
jgi:hypothetical protein